MASRDLADCHRVLAERFKAVRLRYVQDHPGHALEITCTHRSPEEQFALYQKGRQLSVGRWVVVDPARIVTKCDGTIKVSLHNVTPARALDVVVVVGGKWCWAEAEYAPLGPLASEEGLRWGGDWDGNPATKETFVDSPHLELPADVP